MTDAPYFLADFTDAIGTYAKVSLWLRDGVAVSNHPFRLLTVATASKDNLPLARIVVLRNYLADQHTVEFHTDIRSFKVDHFRNNPQACLVFYDPDMRTQVRIVTTVELHNKDDIAHESWRNLHDTSRAAYVRRHCSNLLFDPDTPVETPVFLPEDEEFALGNFLVVRCKFVEMDLLELHPTGHRRVYLMWFDTNLTMMRVAP